MKNDKEDKSLEAISNRLKELVERSHETLRKLKGKLNQNEKAHLIKK